MTYNEVVVQGDKFVLMNNPDLEIMANNFAVCVDEPIVMVEQVRDGVFNISFSGNSLWFQVVSFVTFGDLFSMSLRLRNGEDPDIIWSKSYKDVKFQALLNEIVGYAKNGFPGVAAGMPGGPLGLAGEGGVLTNSWQLSAVSSEPEQGGVYPVGEPYDTIEDSPDFTQEAEDDTVTVAPQESIVPTYVGRCRVVTLKHHGQVIAFRFKTDAGAFDMRKEVAAKFGLAGFKSDKYIALESVNGLLMSSLERESRQCVPDVSDCPEDCKRLMDALFEAQG